MAGIITNVGEDIKSLKQLRQEIENVKKALGSIDINVKIDIRKELEQKLQALTKQYDTLVSKAAEADAKLMESAARIDKAVDTITKSQEKAAKANSQQAAATDKGQTAAIEVQAKAYVDLKDEIDSILGTREQNIKQMMQEQNAIKLINAEIAQINKSRQYGGGLTATQSQRLQKLNDSLLTHKQALAEVRQELNNNAKLDIAAVGSMNELSQSLSRMRIAYRALNEDERNSQFGQNLLKSIQEADARIKELDATIGNHQRNVGNYNGFNGLNMSVQQIVRELPSATMGINMFFMAISNNLPIMADQIKLAKEANKAMKAAGQEPVPVWKQLVSSLFSWQSAMMVGITLLTVYGKDIANWVKELFNAKTAISDLLFTQQQLNAAQKEARKDAISEQVKLKTLYATTQDTTLALKDRLTAVKQLKEQYPSYFSQLSNEAILAGKAAKAYELLTADILKAAQARAYEKKIEELSIQNFDLEDEKKELDDYFKKNKKAYQTSIASHNATDNGGARAFVPTGVDMSGGKRNGTLEIEWSEREERLKKHTEQLNRNNKTIKELTDRVAKINSIRYNLENQSDFKPQKNNSVKDTTPKPVDYDKMARERSDAERELSDKATQASIDAMEDGYEKEKAQRDFNHKKELEELEKYKRDFLQKKIADAREIFEADPKNKGKKFDASSVKLSDKEQAKFDKMKADVEKSHTNENRKAEEERIKNQRAAWQTYYKEFGTYAEKRKALQEELNDKLAEIDKKNITDGQKKAEKATIAKQYANQLDELDNSVRNSTTLMGQLFADASKKSISEIEGIIDKVEMLLAYIEAVKDENGNATINGKNVSRKDIIGMGISENSLSNLENDPTRIESTRSALDRLKGDLGAKSPFVILKRQIKDAIDEMNKGGKNNIAAGIMLISKAISDFLPKVKEFGNSLGTILGNDGIGDKIGRAADAFDGLAMSGQGVAQIMSGDIVGGAMSAVSGISKVVSALDGMFGADYSHYNDMVAKYDVLNGIWDELIDKKTRYIEKSYGNEVLQAGDEAVELVRKKQESARILGNERLNSGASTGSRSIGRRQWKRMNGEAWSQAREALGSDWKDSYDDKGRMEWIFELSAEQLKKLKEADIFWSKLDEDVREYLDRIIDGEEQINDILEKQKEKLNQMAFDDVFDGFLDSLYKIADGSDDVFDDIGKNWQKMVNKMVINNVIGAKMKESLKGWYDKLAELNEKYADKKISDSEYQKELKKLKDEYDSFVKKTEREIESARKAGIITSEGNEEQKATINEARNLSEDTGSQIVGRLTAVQIAVESGSNKRDGQNTQLSLMNMKMDDFKMMTQQVRNIADETRSILADSYLELKGINENTGKSASHLGEIRTDIKELKKIMNDKL